MFSEFLPVLQLALGLVFLMSFVGKIWSPKQFAKGVAEYRLLPKSAAYPFAMFLVMVEAWLAIAHLSGWFIRLAVPAGTLTLAIFASAVGINLGRGRILPCYCFGGHNGEQISGRTLMRVLVLLSAELILLVQPFLFVGSHARYRRSVMSFTQFGLAFFWATFVLSVGYWLFLLPELVALTMHREKG